MTTRAEIRVEGIRELTRSLRRVGSEYPKEQTKIHREIAEPIASEARLRVRSRSGRLAGSIRPLAGQRYARVAAGKASMAYGAINHWGGYPGSYGGNPFLTDALTNQADSTLDLYVRLTDAFLDRVWEATR